jgi:hypothetical protein
MKIGRSLTRSSSEELGRFRSSLDVDEIYFVNMGVRCGVGGTYFVCTCARNLYTQGNVMCTFGVLVKTVKLGVTCTL